MLGTPAQTANINQSQTKLANCWHSNPKNVLHNLNPGGQEGRAQEDHCTVSHLPELNDVRVEQRPVVHNLSLYIFVDLRHCQRSGP